MPNDSAFGLFGSLPDLTRAHSTFGRQKSVIDKRVIARPPHAPNDPEGRTDFLFRESQKSPLLGVGVLFVASLPGILVAEFLPFVGFWGP